MSPARIGRSSDASISRRLEPAVDGLGDARRQPHRRRGRRLRPAATRARRGSACSCFSVGQISTSPAWPARCGDMPDRRRRRGHAGRALAARRRCGRPRPAAARRRGTTSSAARGATAAAPRSARCGERRRPSAANMRGRRALEAVDRLLLVADGEQRARHVAGAAARRRTPRPARGSPATAPGSCPAPRRPGCGRARRRACRAPTRPPPESASRLAALADQVVEVERRAPRLGLAVALHARRCRAAAAPCVASSQQPLVRSLCSGDESPCALHAATAAASACSRRERLGQERLARLACLVEEDSSASASMRPAGRAGGDGRTAGARPP